MRGREYNYVMYSEYSGDTVIDEQDRCLINNIHKKGLEDWNVSTFGYGDWLEFENLKFKDKGEKKVKIIVKNKETGKQKCIDIPKERENDSDVKALKVGMTVYYLENIGCSPELVEIVKIVDDRPKAKGVPFDYIINPKPFTWNPWAYAKRAGRGTFTRKYLDSLIQQNEGRKGRKEYREKPYFLVRLDPIKGQSDSEENLEKIKFPCWCVYKHTEFGKHYIGQLVTGYPNDEVEYQLINMMEQVPAGDVCTVQRSTNLEELMKRFYIEIIKGETQCWKMGAFNV